MKEDPVYSLPRGSSGPTFVRRRRVKYLAAAAGALWGTATLANPHLSTVNGVPQQIIPQVPEVGLPNYTAPTGTVSLFGGSSGTGATVSGGTVPSTGSNALDTMLATPWGASAQQSSEALGVNASALAATCVMESGCQNVPGSGSITGAFQMTAATYQSSLAAALAENPNLAANIVPGLAGQSDPATQAIAAAEYLKQGAQYLQNNGVSNPTTLDVRGYYNFGPQNGANLAQADNSQLMSSAMPFVSSATLASNGISSGETVGQWRAGVAAKMGTAGSQSVLS